MYTYINIYIPHTGHPVITVNQLRRTVTRTVFDGCEFPRSEGDTRIQIYKINSMTHTHDIHRLQITMDISLYMG
jgi:hypothetical protein